MNKEANKSLTKPSHKSRIELREKWVKKDKKNVTYYTVIIPEGFNDDRLLGRGGFSKVYLGMTRRKKMRIAIKLLNANEADPETLDRQLNYEIDQVVMAHFILL